MRLDDYYTLGRSGLRVGRLALGTMTLGTEWGWGADETTARQLFDAYLEAGGNFNPNAAALPAGRPAIAPKSDSRARLPVDASRELMIMPGVVERRARRLVLLAVLAVPLLFSAGPRDALAGPSQSLQPGVNRVTFDSDGIELVGHLHVPSDHRAGKRLPAVVVVGSLTSVKEQMSGLYAQRLADRGFIALAFDYRNFGESGGEPRQYESPRQHIADIRNAVSFLTTQPSVDGRRIAGLGICTGGAYMGVATAMEPRIKAYSAVASHLASEQTNLLLYGGESGVQARRHAGRRAMSRYRSEGHVEYLLAYSNKPGDATASHSGPMEYYFDASRGHILPWTNRFAVMSWEEWLDFNALEFAPDIRVPSLVVHGDNSALPGNARIFFEKIGASDKKLVWSNEPHFDFYDRDASSKAAEMVAEHFSKALGRAEL